MIIMHRHPFASKVGHFFRRLAEDPGGMIVAVSGGPDSMALLRVLLELRRTNPTSPLIVAHLNHQLRGADSDADEAFVQQQHALLQATTPVPLAIRCERRDIAAEARLRGENLESTARQLRYDWLVQTAQETHLRWIATGHTADDQAETILHRLIRGAGLKGLRGIAARRPLTAGIELLRPLLAVTRAEVLAYLEDLGQPYRHDRSNDDPAFTRNRIRQELLPLLARDFNPAIAKVLTRLAEQANETFQEHEARAMSLLAEAELQRAGQLLVFDRQRLQQATRNQVREVYRLAWTREGWPAGGMSFAHWDRLAALVFGENSAIDLPDGLRAEASPRVIRIGPAAK